MRSMKSFKLNKLTKPEHAILQRIRRAKFFVFLRHHRHALFSETFQQDRWRSIKTLPGSSTSSPAQLALATSPSLHRVSDDEVIEATTMDRRWQLVLDCLDTETPLSAKGPGLLPARLIAQQLDRRLLERTVELAATSGAFGSSQLRAALDSSPLWGAGRVEDTYNLLGHALRKAVSVIARQQGRGLCAVAQEAGPPWWRDRASKRPWIWIGTIPRRAQALTIVLDALLAVEAGSKPSRLGRTPCRAAASLAVAHQVFAQDLTPFPAGAPTLRHGVAPERRIRVEDGEMRHGRRVAACWSRGISAMCCAIWKAPDPRGRSNPSQRAGSECDRQHRGRSGSPGVYGRRIAHRPGVSGKSAGQAAHRRGGDLL